MQKRRTPGSANGYVQAVQSSGAAVARPWQPIAAARKPDGLEQKRWRGVALADGAAAAINSNFFIYSSLILRV